MGWSVRVPIQKLNEDERLAFGMVGVYTDDSGNLIFDHHDHGIEEHELEKGAYEYVTTARAADEMHDRLIDADLVESFVLTKSKRAALAKAGMGVDAEGPVLWWVGFKVKDDAVWSKVKDGTYSEFSLTGEAEEHDAKAA